MMKSSMDLTATSNVSEVLFENGRVRVLRVVFQPNQTAKMHHHPDHIIYTIKGGMMRLASKQKSDNVEMKEGTVTFFNATDPSGALKISSALNKNII